MKFNTGFRMARGDNTPQGPWGKPPPAPPPSPPGNRETPDFNDFLQKLQDKFKQNFTKGKGNSSRGIGLALLVLLAIYLLSGFYKVEPEEKAVIMRFGQFNRIADSGLNYHLPEPFEEVIKEGVTRINRVEVGFRSTGTSHQRAQQDLPEESLMLTGDENIVDINFEVQWRISDIRKFIFNLRNPEDTVKSAAESAMREVIGRNLIASALAEGRLGIEQQTQVLLQHILDSYDVGVELVTVRMLKVDPPTEVIDAFRDVQTARADKERAQNEAEAYRNDIIPRARGEAERIEQEAEGYKQQIVAGAQGDSSRFLAIYDKYKNAKEVTKRRMYLETMQEILDGMNKIILDKGGNSGAVPYLSLNELMKKKDKEAAKQ